MRKSKNDAFCFFTQFAFTKAYGKGEFAALYSLCALKSAAKRGKPFGFPLKLTENRRRQLAEVFVNTF